jgi:hypothetical protein
MIIDKSLASLKPRENPVATCFKNTLKAQRRKKE